ncbi:MAG TPA: winged helix-turn-helix domain-containing protein [Hyphomonadaceae bacterium]|nr:winged helix-turn-helix domain-containing protein [Hyphomonadaceae bacterium]
MRPSTREVVLAGHREVLEPRVMMVLVRLAQSRGEVVTRDDLTDACWEGRIVSDDAINRVISRIRRVADLTAAKDFTLETITKVGYRLVAQATVPAVEPAKPIAAAPDPAQAKTDQAVPPIRRRPWRPFALAAAGVVVAIGLGWAVWAGTGWHPKPTDPLTLAVLPFDSLGAGGTDKPLATAMSRDIRNTLSRVRGLRVVSDTSSFAVAEQKLSAIDIGKRLWADLLVDGDLTITGDTVKLTAELVDAYSGTNLWTGSRQGPIADLDGLKTQISAAIFEQIVARVGSNRVEMLTPSTPVDPRIYQLTIQASELLEEGRHQRTIGQPDVALDLGEKAWQLIQQALAIDPKAPQALVLEATATGSAVTRELASSNTSITDRQAAAATILREALAADPDNPSALAWLAEHHRRNEWLWSDAKALFQRAIALDPNLVEAHVNYGYYLSMTGRCVDALEQADIASKLDPEFGWQTFAMPRVLKCLGLVKASDEAYQRALVADPGSVFLTGEVYLNYLMRHDTEGLRRFIAHMRDDLWKGMPPPDLAAMLNRATLGLGALEGNPAPYAALLESDSATIKAEIANGLGRNGRRISDVSWTLAEEFAIAGKPQRAIDLLSQAIENGSIYNPDNLPGGQFEFSPEVRANPRYQALWKSDPRLVELIRLRTEALKARQMAGFLPDGTKVVPDLRNSTPDLSRFTPQPARMVN